MPDSTEPSDTFKKRTGAALRLLRARSGKTGEVVAEGADIHPQTYRNYESGRRLPDDPMIERLVRVMGYGLDDFHAEMRERAAGDLHKPPAGEGKGDQLLLPVGGYAFGGAARPAVYDLLDDPEIVDFREYFSAGTRVLRLGGMSMVPYAEPGGFVTYNPRRPARRGQGAVIELSDGSYHVKRFERTTVDKLIVTELYPEEREIEFQLSDVVGVYAIGLRGD